MDEDTRDGRPPAGPRLFGAVVLLAGVLAHLPAVRGPFVFDDLFYVVDNAALRDTPLSALWRFFLERTNAVEFAPLRDLSLRVDLALFGQNPVGFHVHNLLLYVATCAAVWLATAALAEALGWREESPRARRWLPAIATALFAAHPAHVEAVAWVSGRKDLLSGLFGLLALTAVATSLTGAGPWRAGLAGAGLLGAAVLSKPAAVALAPALLGLLVVARPSRVVGVGRRLGVAVPALLVAALLGWIGTRVGAETRIGLDAAEAPLATWTARSGHAVAILGALGRITLAPWRPRLIYDVEDLLPLNVALGAGLLVAAAAGLVLAARRRSIAGFGAFFFVVTCAPYLQLVPFTTWSEASERFVFTASFGATIAAAAAVVGLAERTRPAWVASALGVLLVAGLATTGAYASLWRSPDRLTEATIARTPRAAVMRIRSELMPERRYAEVIAAAEVLQDAWDREVWALAGRTGFALDAGDLEQARPHAERLAWMWTRTEAPELAQLLGRYHDLAGNDAEALRYYGSASFYPGVVRQQCEPAMARVRARAAARLESLRSAALRAPGDPEALAALAAAEMELWLLDDAERDYRAALARVDHPVLRYNLGLVLARARRHAEAAVELRAAIDGGVAHGDAWNNLGLSLRAVGDRDTAATAFANALAKDPQQWFAAVNLAALQVQGGDRDGAIASLDEATRRAGADPAKRAVIDAWRERVEE